MDIGKTAGDIWQYLGDNKGTADTFKLKMVIGVNNASLYLALGWLLREDKIVIEALEKGYKISKK